MKVRIAVVQFRTRLHDPDTNLRRMAQFVQRARSRGADVVTFPEEFLTGPVSVRPEMIDRTGRFLRAFREMARANRIDIVAGSIAEWSGGRAQNAAYYVDRTGKVLSRYAKVNLWLTERTYATPGDTVQAFKTRYGKVGLSICWDLAFPEIYRTYARQDATIVFNASLWSREDAGPGLAVDPNAEPKFINACCTARAFEEELIVVYTNCAGHWTLKGKRYHSAGQSQITVPFKGPLKRIAGNREALFVQDVDDGVLKLAAAAYEIRKDLATGRRLG